MSGAGFNHGSFGNFHNTIFVRYLEITLFNGNYNERGQ